MASEISPSSTTNPKLLEERLANLEENYLHCVICFEQYEDPRILDCVHSFCLQCIKNHVKQSRTVKCPICNQEMRTPKNGVENLKVNFFIKNLIDEFSHMTIKENSGTASEYFCESCTAGNPATVYCKDCNCNICFICEDQHARLKIWQDHSVVPIPKKQLDDQDKENLIKKAQKDTKQIDRNMKGVVRVLQHKVSFLENRIGSIEESKNKTLAKIDESQDKFTRFIKKYVDDLKETVSANADERLGNMKEVLEANQKKLEVLNDLKKQRDVLDDVNIKDHATLSEELMKNLETFVQEFSDLPSEVIPVGFEEKTFIESNKKSREYTACSVEFVGFLTPIVSRQSRHVNVFTQEMSGAQTDYAVECTHEVLDELGDQPRRVRTYNNIAERIIDKFIKRYERGKWASIVTPEGGWGINLNYRRLVAFSICEMDVFVFDCSSGK